MNTEQITVRQWQKLYQAGAFDEPNCAVQVDAGWCAWECDTDSLPGRLKKLAKLVMGVTDPYILDNYYILCANRSSRFGKLYDYIGFVPLLDEDWLKSFEVTLDDPRHRKKWSLFTRRYGLEGQAPEFDCQDVRKMIRYVNRIGTELELDVVPPFVGERRAVEVYAHKRRGEPWEIPVYRNDEHRYTYKSWQDGREHTVIVTPDLAAPLSGFIPEQAVPITDIYITCPERLKGLYVYCPEDAGIPLPEHQQNIKNSHKKRKVNER